MFIGGRAIAGTVLSGRDRQLRGELPDGRAFTIDVTDGAALRAGHATLIVDGQIVPLPRRDRATTDDDVGLLH